MKKIKLFTLALAALLAGSVSAETLFQWKFGSSSPEETNVDMSTGNYGTMSIGNAVVSQYASNNKMDYNKKGLKLGNNDVAIVITGTADFEAGDIVTIKGIGGGNGERGFAVGNANAKTCTDESVIATNLIEDKSNLKDYTVTLTDAQAGKSLTIFRYAGKTMYLQEIIVTRPDVAADVATLKSITVNGKALKGFDPATETYNVELPFGTTEVPVVEAVATSKNANPVVTPAAAIPGATTIVVTAEDGTTTKTYTINFTAAQTASSEKELLNVTVDGKAVAISENAGSLLVSKKADLTALVVNFEVSESATASIESGSTHDFTNPLSIVVTAQDNSTATYIITVTKAEKDVLYMTTAGIENDKMYGVVAAKGFYIEVRGEKNDNTDFSGYDLVVLHESLGGKDAEDGELNALATANVPVLNTKSYFYPEGRWGWGACSSGNNQQGVKVNTAKYTNIASHPLFAGLNDSITIYSSEKAKNIQPVTSFAKGKEGYVLANVAGGAAIHELPAAARVGAEGTAKYLLISLLNGQYADLTAEAETLLSNAIDYLLSAEAWVPQSGPQTALDNAVVAEKAQKMIVNGQLVIVKDGVRYNAQGAKL